MRIRVTNHTRGRNKKRFTLLTDENSEKPPEDPENVNKTEKSTKGPEMFTVWNVEYFSRKKRAAEHIGAENMLSWYELLVDYIY